MKRSTLVAVALALLASTAHAETKPATQTSTPATFGYNGMSRPDLGCPNAHWTQSKDVAAEDCLYCRNLYFDPDCTMDHYTGNIIYGDCNPNDNIHGTTDPINYFLEGYYCTSGTLNTSNNTCTGAYVCDGPGWALVGSTCYRDDCDLGTYRNQSTGICEPEKDLGEPCSQ